MIRADVKALVKAGMLPADWVYSVRKRSCTHSWSIDVRATSPRPLYAANPSTYDEVWVKHAETGEMVHGWKDRLTLEAGAVLDTLEDLHRGYNHDGSETQVDYFDVKFYGSVTLDVAAGVERWVPAVKS